MGLHLCIDVGNTATKIGVFEESKLVYAHRFERILIRDLRNLEKRYHLQKAIISATGKLRESVQRYLEDNFDLLALSHHVPIPIENKYLTPETLGRDRIAAVVGAFSLYPGQNNLVIDLGTCITFDFLDKKNTYCGGNIAPGIELRLKSMHYFTQRLPLVERKKNENLLGLTTESAIQNGAIWGIKCEIEAIIEMLKSQYQRINVILTGGDSSFFEEMIKTKIFVHPNLVLFGLDKILAFNAK